MTTWRFSASLSCGHDVDLGYVSAVDVGVVSTWEHSNLVPLRKDGSFGSLECPLGCGRRRVRSTRTSRELNEAA